MSSEDYGDGMGSHWQREIESLRAALAAEREAHEKTRTQLTCGTCGNAGPHPSGLTCICGGTGRMEDEARNARLAAIEALQERDAAIARAETAERERDEARAEIERLEAIEMPADVEQAFERGWSARAAATRRAERERDEVRAACAAMRRVLLDVWDASSRGDEEGCQQGNNLDLTLAICATKTVTDATDAGAPLLAELRALRAVRDAAEALLVDFSRDDLVWESDRHRIARLRAALDAAKDGGMGYGTRQPTSNDPPLPKHSRWLTTTDVLDEIPDCAKDGGKEPR